MMTMSEYSTYKSPTISEIKWLSKLQHFWCACPKSGVGGFQSLYCLLLIFNFFREKK
jgi:hypothetical protein